MTGKGKFAVYFLVLVFFAAVFVILRSDNRQILGDAVQKHIPSGIPELSSPPPISLTPSGSASAVFYQVVWVSDGDTFSVLIDNVRETVRAIGINTPETVDPRKPVECFGKEASKRAKELLQGKRVRLKADPTQQDRDKYGRILRYVYLTDGAFFNKAMIAEGYAFEYTYDIPYQFQEEFKKAEQAAREGNRGLWNVASCNGKK